MVFKGNPICIEGGDISKPKDKEKIEVYPEIKKRIPSVQFIDGDLLKYNEKGELDLNK